MLIRRTCVINSLAFQPYQTYNRSFSDKKKTSLADRIKSLGSKKQTNQKQTIKPAKADATKSKFSLSDSESEISFSDLEFNLEDESDVDLSMLTEEEKAKLFSVDDLNDSDIAEFTKSKKESDLNLDELAQHMYTGSIYEFVRVNVQADHHNEFTQLIPDIILKKEVYGKLVSAFSVQIGNVNEIVHIWEWDSVKERQIGIETLAKDSAYQTLTNNALSLIMNQKRSFLGLKADSLFTKFTDEYRKQPTQQGVYELEFGSSSRKLLPTIRSLRKSYSGFLVGEWFPLVNEYNREKISLWRYDTLFEYEKYVVEAGSQLKLPNTTELLYPTLYSPLQ